MILIRIGNPRVNPKVKGYQSSGSLLWARAVRTAASPVWPAQERGMEEAQNRQMRHAMALKTINWTRMSEKDRKN